jgi:regulatory protein
VPTVTALARVGRDRVAVDVDGRRWRIVPREAAVLAGVAVGVELDRARLRALRHELRRTEALGAAVGALRYRDHTRSSLARRLQARGVAPAARRAVLDVLDRAGVVDDERFALGRAAALARRGAGDLLIAADLERQGVPTELVERALSSLEPESERARRTLAALGVTPRALRRLAAKGFRPETVELFVADSEDGAVP